MTPIKVLFVSDNDEQYSLFQDIVDVKKLPYYVERIKGLDSTSELDFSQYDIILSNYWIQGGTLLDLLPLTDITPCIIMAELGSETHIQQSIQQGALDFVMKDPENRYLSLLPIVIRKTLRYVDFAETNYDMLRMSEKRYENLVQAIPDIVYKLDPGGHILFINNAVRSLGYEPEDLIGKHFRFLLEDSDQNHVSRDTVLPAYEGIDTGDEEAPKLFDERRSGERKTVNLQVRIKKKIRGTGRQSGESMLGSVISYGEVSATGQYRTSFEKRYFTGTVGIIRDITTRKKSEQMLNKLYHAVDQTPVSIIIFDYRGFIEYVNPYFIRSNGYSPSDVLGHHVTALVSPSLPEDTLTIIRDTLSKGNSWKGELGNLAKDGTEHKNNIHISPVFDQDQNITDYIAIAETVSSSS
jgi:PAS domain S-box-containing protein